MATSLCRARPDPNHRLTGTPTGSPEILAGLMDMSASTIDRSLRGVREQAGGRRRRRTAPSPVRRSTPVCTFSDWDDPPPWFAEADLAAHSGPVPRGSFVQTLVVTDVATGWTECAPVLYRERTLLREVLGEVRRPMPFRSAGLRHGQRQRVHQRDPARLLPRRGDRVSRAADRAQVRPGVRRAEERRGRPAHRRLPPPRGLGRRGGAVAALRHDEAVRLPALVQAGVQAARRCPGEQALPVCFGRCACISNGSWRSPNSLSPRSRRMRPCRRWNGSSQACGPLGPRARRDRLRSTGSRSANVGGLIRWSG